MYNADSTDGTDSALIKTNEVELDTQPFNEQNVFLFSHPFESHHPALESLSQHIKCTMYRNRGCILWTPEEVSSKWWNL